MFLSSSCESEDLPFPFPFCKYMPGTLQLGEEEKNLKNTVFALENLESSRKTKEHK